MVKFREISEKLRSKRLFIFDFDETIINLNLNWNELKAELSDYVKKQFNIEMTFTPILEKLEFLKTQISKKDFQPISDYLINGEIIALKECSTKQVVGFSLLEDIFAKIVQPDKENRFIAILSNNFTKTIKLGVKQYKIDSMISYFVGRDMVTRIKPDIEGIKIIHDHFPSIKKSEIVYFGDSPIYDKNLAQNYGIDFYLISHPK